MSERDLIVVGAGPAGMAAARTAADQGASVLVLDEQPGAGGQIYRSITASGPARGGILGADYMAGRRLADGLAHPRIEHVAGAVVWRVDPSTSVAWSRGGAAEHASARALVVASGALERPVPIPGWTLPGVMTAGAGQILLKSSGVVPRDAVLAGSGPLVYLLAQQLINAGAPPKILVETQPFGAYLRAARHLPAALRGWRQLWKGSVMLAAIRRAGIRRVTGASGLRVLGEDSATALAFTSRNRTEEIACDTVLLHQGVIPNVQITRSLRLSHVWDPAQRCWRPRLDAWGRTDIETIFVAGDGAGIAGAGAAALRGRIAALAALCDMGLIDGTERDRQAGPLRRALRTETAARPLLDTLYAPPQEILTPSDKTIVCRCEEITAGDVRRYARMGCAGPNQAKAFGRAGMGPCQGRYCGLTVSEIMAQANGRTPAEIGYYRIRSPLKPVTLGELATLADAPRGEQQ